jgi:pimeloyl-ACP methyl ester carboxylesterase
MVRRNLPFRFPALLSPGVLLCLLAWPQGIVVQHAAAEDELPAPAEVKLDCIDGVSKLIMHCTYYESPMVEKGRGKEVIPIVLLHGRGGTRGDYEVLAKYLQEQGHAVLAPDLRGHGDSSELLVNGNRIKLNPAKMKKGDFALMVKDLEAVKSWLLQKNNAEELNMEMLVVAGSDMSSVTAMNFALRDWTVPELINYKNCKDVKALVLLSPERSYEGTEMNLALKHPIVGHKLSVLIIEGKKNGAGMAESKKILNLLERNHLETSAEKSKEDKEVVFFAEDTSLQGTKLVNPPAAARVAPIIAQFIQFRVKALQDGFPWTKRVKPGDE